MSEYGETNPFLLRTGTTLPARLRGEPLIALRKALPDVPRDRMLATAALGAAVFAGGLALGVLGALALGRSRRGLWEQHAERAVKIAGEIGMALASEALRIAHNGEAAAATIEADVVERTIDSVATARDTLASLALRALQTLR